MHPISLRSWLIGLLIAIPISYVLFFPELIRCQTIQYAADFKRLTASSFTLYISRNTPIKTQQQLIRNHQQAISRLKNFWLVDKKKALQGQAVLIYCHTEEQYLQLCGGLSSSETSAGCSLGTPWGQSFLIIGPAGNSPDVIAHERCHDELFARLGWWRIQQQIPQWFNEGLALMVDYRFTSPNPAERYQDLHDEWLFRAQSGQEVIDLRQLESTRDFFSGNYYHVLLAYLTAAKEVAHWLAICEPQGLVTLTERVRTGENFQKVYTQLRQQKIKKRHDNHRKR